MRLYATVSGVLLILSIIDFALAAPVLVQENRRAYVDVMHIPEDVITVLGKRGSEELLEELSGTLEKTIESSDAHASSSSLPPGPDKGSTNDVKAPALNPTALPTVGSSDLSTDPDWLVATLGSDHELMGAGTHAPQPNPIPNAASSAARPDPEFIKLTSSSSTTSSDSEWLLRYGSHGGFLATIAHIPTLLASGSGHELTGAGAHLPQPNPNPAPSAPSSDLIRLTSSSATPSTDSSDYDSWDDATESGSDHESTSTEAGTPVTNWESPTRPRLGFGPVPGPSPEGFHWRYWINLGNQPHENPVAHVQQPNLGPSTDGNLDELLLPPLKRPKLASSIEFSQAHHEDHVAHVQQSVPGPSTDANFDWNDERFLYAGPGTSNRGPSNPRRPIGFDGPPPNPELTNPELHSDDPSESQSVEAQAAALYALKGKAKESRWYSRHR